MKLLEKRKESIVLHH